MVKNEDGVKLSDLTTVQRRQVKELERLLYQSVNGLSNEELGSLLPKEGEGDLCVRSVQGIIKCLREVYKGELRGRNDVVGCKLKRLSNDHELLFPDNAFVDFSDKSLERLRLLVKVIKLFNIPLDDHYLGNSSTQKEDDEEDTPLLNGIRFRGADIAGVFTRVFEAIRCQDVIKIEYATGGGKTQTQYYSPYFFIEYNYRWHLIAHRHQDPGAVPNLQIYDWTDLSLYNIKKVEVYKGPTPLKYNTRFMKESRAYYEKIVGTYIDDECYDGNRETDRHPRADKLLSDDIILTARDAKSFRYLTETSIHPSQKVLSKKEFRVKYHCIKNSQLVQALMSKLYLIQWIEPADLREKVLQQMEEAKELLSKTN